MGEEGQAWVHLLEERCDFLGVNRESGWFPYVTRTWSGLPRVAPRPEEAGEDGAPSSFSKACLAGHPCFVLYLRQEEVEGWVEAFEVHR